MPPEFPHDILLEILSHTTHTPTLLALSILTRTLQPAAQKRLFSTLNISLQSYKLHTPSTQLLYAALITSPHLLSYVHTLHLATTRETTPSRRRHSQNQQTRAELRDLLSLFGKHLRVFSLVERTTGSMLHPSVAGEVARILELGTLEVVLLKRVWVHPKELPHIAAPHLVLLDAHLHLGSGPDPKSNVEEDISGKEMADAQTRIRPQSMSVSASLLDLAGTLERASMAVGSLRRLYIADVHVGQLGARLLERLFKTSVAEGLEELILTFLINRSIAPTTTDLTPALAQIDFTPFKSLTKLTISVPNQALSSDAALALTQFTLTMQHLPQALPLREVTYLSTFPFSSGHKPNSASHMNEGYKSQLHETIGCLFERFTRLDVVRFWIRPVVVLSNRDLKRGGQRTDGLVVCRGDWLYSMMEKAEVMTFEEDELEFQSRTSPFTGGWVLPPELLHGP